MKALIIILCIILFFVLLFHIPVSVYLSYADKVLKADIKYFFFRTHAEGGFYNGEFKVIFPEKKKKKKKRRRRKKKKEEDISDIPSENSTADVPAETEDTETAVTAEQSDEAACNADPDSENHPQFDGLDITYIDNDSAGESQDVSEDDEEPPEKKFIDEKIEELEKKIGSVLMIWDLNKKYLFRIFGAVSINDVSINILTAGCDACTAALRYGKANAAVWNIISLIRTFFRVTLLNVDIKCSFDEDEHSKAMGSCIIRFAPSALISNGSAMLFVTLINLKKIFPDGIGNFLKKKK